MTSAGLETNPADNADSAIATVGTGVFGFGVTLDDQGQANVSWIDEAVNEAEFGLEFSAGGSPWVSVASVTSTTVPGTGMTYSWTSPPLVAGTEYAVRVVARDRDGRPIATAGGTASPPALPAAEVGCLDARITLEGRARHDGAIVLMDGIPVRLSERDGSADFCGAAPGARAIAAQADGHLEASAVVDVLAGGTLELPGTSLPGGDVNGDSRVSVVDLVRVGAAQGKAARAGARLTTDANRDGITDLSDLVVVASSYSLVAPVPWHEALGGPAVFGALESAFDEVDGFDDGFDVTDVAGLSDGPIVLEASTLADGRVSVDVTARGVRDLFGADVVFTYDPSLVTLVDADNAAGIQVAPGEAWAERDEAFVAAGQVEDAATAWVRFAATRRAPATSLRGDVVLFTAVFEAVDGGELPETAWSILSARLLTAAATEIDAAIDGLDLRSPIDWGRFSEDIHLPFVTR